jgi:hypothetical protein
VGTAQPLATAATPCSHPHPHPAAAAGPQGQANRWVKALERDAGLEVARPSSRDFLRTIENGVRFGRPVLLEDVGEALDAALEPLLLRSTYRQGGCEVLRLGESVVPYHKDFRFRGGWVGVGVAGVEGKAWIEHIMVLGKADPYMSGAGVRGGTRVRLPFAINPSPSPRAPTPRPPLHSTPPPPPHPPQKRFYMTTRLANPAYAPEVAVKVSLLNFFVTPEGLEDQLLGVAVDKVGGGLRGLRGSSEGPAGGAGLNYPGPGNPGAAWICPGAWIGQSNQFCQPAQPTCVRLAPLAPTPPPPAGAPRPVEPQGPAGAQQRRHARRPGRHRGPHPAAAVGLCR